MLIDRHKRVLGILSAAAFCASSVAFAGLTTTNTTTHTASNTVTTSTTTQNDTQEKTLLTNLEILESQATSKSDYTTKALAEITQYDKTAPAAQRTDRLLQAMVDMRMTTASQARTMNTTIEKALTAQFSMHPEMTEAQREQFAANTTLGVMNASMNGAQFSGCTGMFIGASAVLSGAILVNVYAQDMTAPAGYEVNRTEQDMLMATAGIMYGVSIVMFIYDMSSGICD